MEENTYPKLVEIHIVQKKTSFLKTVDSIVCQSDMQARTSPQYFSKIRRRQKINAIPVLKKKKTSFPKTVDSIVCQSDMQARTSPQYFSKIRRRQKIYAIPVLKKKKTSFPRAVDSIVCQSDMQASSISVKFVSDSKSM